MRWTARVLTAGVLTAATLLTVAGCGDTDADTDSTADPTDTSQPRPQVTRDVSLEIGHGTNGSKLSATNESDARLLVLLPVGEPVREEKPDGVTLTYLRSGSASTADEPELYEAAALSPGSTRPLDLSTAGTWTSKVSICLETVPTDDVAAEAGGGTYRVQAREDGTDAVVACSPMAKLHSMH